MSALETLGSEIGEAAGANEISEIADHYLGIVGGGLMVNFSQFMQYTENTGDNGPHGGPFWEQVIREY